MSYFFSRPKPDLTWDFTVQELRSRERDCGEKDADGNPRSWDELFGLHFTYVHRLFEKDGIEGLTRTVTVTLVSVLGQHELGVSWLAIVGHVVL